MVLLTMTPAIVQALDKIQDGPAGENKDLQTATSDNDSEPSLYSPKLGNPISHTQLLSLSKSLKAAGYIPYHLDNLLRGTSVYIPPPPPKPAQTAEYKALMARLRAEEESRAYDRMLNPPLPAHPTSSYNSASLAFSSTAAHTPFNSTKEDAEDLSLANVNSQISLIANVLISVVCCAAAIWMVARWWSTPARLALSMSGSLLVGVAEVVVYIGYVRRR